MNREASIKYWIVIVFFLGYRTVAGQKKSFPIHVGFQNWVGDRQLALDSTYTNSYGEVFTIRNFRYYISHLSFIGTNGKVFDIGTPFLVDERNPAGRGVTSRIPFSSIKAISFIVGVDSAKNVSGVQTGSLDPANGMFWTWNSGYIFAKLEGSSPQAKAPQNNFTYHIGGFRTGENAERKVTLGFNEPVKNSVRPAVFIKADVNAWFNGVHAFKIADQPSIMTPGPLAMQVADNYSKMFSIVVPD